MFFSSDLRCVTKTVTKILEPDKDLTGLCSLILNRHNFQELQRIYLLSNELRLNDKTTYSQSENLFTTQRTVKRYISQKLCSPLSSRQMESSVEIHIGWTPRDFHPKKNPRKLLKIIFEKTLLRHFNKFFLMAYISADFLL